MDKEAPKTTPACSDAYKYVKKLLDENLGSELQVSRPEFPNLGELTTTAFHSNHTLSNAEITSVQEQMERCRLEEEDILLNMEAAKTILQELRKERADNRREIVALKWSLSPIRRFSDGLFSYMFEILVLEGEISPWTLMRVCQKFRLVAQTTPKIWSRLSVTMHDPCLGRYSYGRENCWTAKHLQNALHLSGESLLDISISTLSTEMVHLLLAERWRWERIRLYNGSSEPLAHEVKALFVMPNEQLDLKKVTLSGISDMGVVFWLEASRPRSLCLRSCLMNHFRPIVWWNTLQELELDGSKNCPLHGPSVHAILSTVRLHLVNLSITEIDFEGRFTKNMEFPKIRNLCMVSVSHWWMIFAPQVVSLRLEPKSSAPPGTMLDYESLKELIYRADKAPLSSETFKAPQLVFLSIISPASAKLGENLVWSTSKGQISNMAATEITIDGEYNNKSDINFKDLIDSLRPHTSLKKLKLRSLKLSIVFYKSLLQTKTTKTDPLCPSLRELEVNMDSIRTKVDISLHDQVFTKIEQERAQSTSPLIRLLITWPGYQYKPTDYAKGEKLTKREFSPIWFGDSSDDDSDGLPYSSTL